MLCLTPSLHLPLRSQAWSDGPGGVLHLVSRADGPSFEFVISLVDFTQTR